MNSTESANSHLNLPLRFRQAKHWSYAFLFLCALLGSGVLRSAQNQILVERFQSSIELPVTKEFLKSQANSSVGFAPVAASKMMVTRSKPVLWRVRVDSFESPIADVLLVVDSSFDRDVMLYFPPDYHAETHNLFDTRTPSEHSRFRLAIRLPDRLKTSDVFFMAMAQPTAAPLELQILDRVDYARRDLNLVRLHSAIISMLIASSAVALCFFVILRERVWLYFIAYVFAVIAYVLTRTGELLAILETTKIDRWVWQAATISPLLIAALLAFFIVEFVKLKDTTPRTARALQIYGITLSLIAVLAVIPEVANSDTLSSFANLLLLIGVSLTLYSSIFSARLGSRPALFFLTAYLPQIFAAVLSVAQIRGLIGGGIWINVFFLSSYAFSSIILSLGMADQVLAYRRERDAAINESQRDPLTGAFNRRAANAALARAIQRLDAKRGSLAVCFFDLDFFKRVNDRFGHALGDEALRLLVAQAQLELRSSDILARLGGEEFIAVLPGAYLRDGLAIAERIRARIETHGKVIAGQAVNLTVSVGVIATNAKLSSADALIDAADQALYLAKSRGRNRVETIDLVSLTKPDVAAES